MNYILISYTPSPLGEGAGGIDVNLRLNYGNNKNGQDIKEV
jgi:hypothetical protein